MTAPEIEPREGTVDELFDAWEDAWSNKDMDAFRQVCSTTVHYEDPLTAEPLEGIPALITHAERLWDAFPDARLEQLGPRLAQGRMATAPCKLLATHREPVGGLPATNKFIVVPVVFYCELERGRLLRVRAFFDLYDAAVQLGVLPGRGSLGEKALLMLRGFGLRAGR
ncbi:MAG TPA: ester cyclase [Solirubrobacteraceae bacterium]|nr:ester cyclase [Solirubrobacteraceae bacterium]